jgi:hypothetical protein
VGTRRHPPDEPPQAVEAANRTLIAFDTTTTMEDLLQLRSDTSLREAMLDGRPSETPCAAALWRDLRTPLTEEVHLLIASPSGETLAETLGPWGCSEAWVQVLAPAEIESIQMWGYTGGEPVAAVLSFGPRSPGRAIEALPIALGSPAVHAFVDDGRSAHRLLLVGGPDDALFGIVRLIYNAARRAPDARDDLEDAKAAIRSASLACGFEPDADDPAFYLFDEASTWYFTSFYGAMTPEREQAWGCVGQGLGERAVPSGAFAGHLDLLLGE